MLKIILFPIIVIAIQSSYAADLYCSSVSGSTCTFSNIANVASADDVVKVVGQASTFVDTTTTSLFIQASSKFSVFPKKILQVFPNASYIFMNDNSFTTLTASSFGDCGKLERIIFLKGKFTVLTARFAETCRNLKKFVVQDSALTTLNSKALLGLVSLKEITLNVNKITCVPPGFFAHAPMLEEIDLSSNQITAIDPFILRGLPFLRNANFVFNKIAFLPTLDLSGTGYVASTPGNSVNPMIAFGGNPITAIHPQYFNSIYQGRTTNFFFCCDYFSTVTTCRSPSNPTACVSTATWVNDKNNYTACYNQWTAAMATTICT